MDLSRRHLLAGLSTLTAATMLDARALGASGARQQRAAPPRAGSPVQPFAPPAGPRSRVIVANDISGDIDGLFALVHALLSPSTEIRGYVGTGTGAKNETAARSVELAKEIASLIPSASHLRIFEGAAAKMTDGKIPVQCAGAQAIIDEAMRSDTTLPLYVTVGGGLTEVASALVMKPEIANRMTLVWIGGGPYPQGARGETNFGIDPLAAQTVFNNTEVPIWQVPSDVYATCQVSDTELQEHVAPCGPIGSWLYAKLVESARTLNQRYGLNTGETYTLGDSPMVLLTALTPWGPSKVSHGFRYEQAGSSHFEDMITPHLLSDGRYEAQSSGRNLRVYRAIDTRLMLDDFFSKLRVNA